MAHLRTLRVATCFTCGKRATVELRGVRNELYAEYCRRHGELAEKRLRRQEGSTA